MRVLIAGGGIGGLTTALSLHEAGIDAVVYEVVPELKELGVGINLLPHAVRVLSALGLQPALAATAIETQALAYYTKRGRLIWREPRGLEAGYQWPQYSIHRGRLSMILARAVRERLGADAIRTGHRVTHVEQDDDGVTVHFVEPETGQTIGSDRGDALVGADGIHSTIRTLLYPDEGAPRFSGITMWRGVTERKPFLDGRTMVIAGNWNVRAVIYPIFARSRGAPTLSRQLGGRDSRRGKDRLALGELGPAWQQKRFRVGLPRLALRLAGRAAALQESDTVFEFPMADRDPVERWSVGRVTLLGDAAHPMYPSGSNAPLRRSWMRLH